MKTHIVLGTALLLTLGSAVAGSLLYGRSEARVVPPAHADVSADQVTPAMIADWKESSTSYGYIAPKVPI